MPYKETTVEKIIFTIGEVADLIGVSASTIRYWESRFDDLSPRKSPKGTRLFSREDIETLKLIKYLVKDRRLTIQGALQKLNDNREETEQTREIADRLKNIKEELIGIRKEMDELHAEN